VFAYRCSLRADYVAAGSNVNCGIDWYNSAGTNIATTDFHTGVLTAINTWYTFDGQAVAPTSAIEGQVYLYKTNAIAFNAWFDSVECWQVNPSFWAYRNGASFSVTGSGVLVQLETEKYDLGGNYDNGAYRWTVTSSGIYSITGRLVLLAMASGSFITSYLRLNASTILVSGSTQYNDGASARGLGSSIAMGAVQLSAGDYVEYYVNNGDSVARDLDHGPEQCFLTATRIL
jgi:hypothetical protein